MATEVTIKTHDSTLGYAFLVKQDEWELFLSEIRDIIKAQEIETPVDYRFLSRNGNVISTTLETNITFRDVVESEPFAEVKKEDTSLQSAEQRVSPPQVTIISVDKSNGQNPHQEEENQCPFINKFPLFAGARGALPCMRHAFNVHTLLKLAFILTCLLFLMIFVLTLCFQVIFGVGTVGHGVWGGMPIYQQQHSTAAFDQDAMTTLKVKFSEMEVANRFEMKDLKQKLAELEDLYLSQYRELEAVRKELSAVRTSQSTSGKQHDGQIDNLTARLSTVEDSLLERWRPEHENFTVGAETESGMEDLKVEEENNAKMEKEEVDEPAKDSNTEPEEAKQEKSKEKKNKKKEKGKKKDKKEKKQKK
ncbi:hypothetical protein EGW08_002061 [Elysia chlorotica]|uniref:Uncharacterized protein n=1 Tax=Elysia chlorotica TaxID=188477 RepID=A0A433U8P5_ELYCH|nr:hypothetical protein EGW08_002061 [Elysia chlorotica]